METIILGKAGLRMVNVYLEQSTIEIIVTAPGMLIGKLQILTNLDAFGGCDAQFYDLVAGKLEGVAYCGHTGPQPLSIEVEKHRLGKELYIDLGPTSMYQNQISLKTKCGSTFKELFQQALSGPVPDDFMVVLYVVRAEGHHEHHHSAMHHIDEHNVDVEGEGHHHG